MYPVKTEILMNVTSYETRLAVIEDGVLQEMHIERPHARGLVGNIYKGKVAKVLPGMQAAFVDIGLNRAGFLHVSEVIPMSADAQSTQSDIDTEDVTKWLTEGQAILVQVIKDPLGTKGARLTTHLSIASRYLVMMPDLQHIGVSVRLEDEDARQQLTSLLEKILGKTKANGYIIRTAAEGVVEKDLARDVAFLQRIWQSITNTAKKAKAPTILYEDLPLYKRAIRDMVNDNVEKIRLDSSMVLAELKTFIREFVPELKSTLSHYVGEMPIFDMYGVEAELQKALQRRVALKSGGYLVIDQTEAMTTIDVNTGAYVGSRNLEETIFKTNLEAAQAIGRQLRLRNLGGIIILDFIDMQDEEHKQQLHTTLTKALARDCTRSSISDISPLGLVQMTRKRTQASLVKQLCEECAHCSGTGVVKTVETVCYEIFRELVREARVYNDIEGFQVIAAQDIVDWLLNEAPQHMGELEATIGKPIRLQVEPGLPREQFDIILM